MVELIEYPKDGERANDSRTIVATCKPLPLESLQKIEPVHIAILQKSQKAAVQSESPKLLQRQSSATRAIPNVSFLGLFEVLTVFKF